MKIRHTAKLASFAILERDGKILLARRFNTGYADGQYQMPSGHVDKGEYPVEAAAREAKEEVGVDIAIEDLMFVHASYRINKVDDAGDYVDFFFKTAKWSGEVINAEPEKCDKLVWVSMSDLPENTVPVIKQVIEYIKKGIPFSEVGRL
jgi:8-oxo-dGTP diphosphatase